MLETIKGTFPDFHNFYLADTTGTTVAFYPPRNERGESTIGINFSDRSYYAQLKETMRPVVSDYPNMKCLFMSGYTANVIAPRGVLDEGVNFIEKPFSRQNLASMVRKALSETK